MDPRASCPYMQSSEGLVMHARVAMITICIRKYKSMEYKVRAIQIRVRTDPKLPAHSD